MIKDLLRYGLNNQSLSRPFGWDSIPRDKNLLWLDKNENIDEEYNRYMSQIPSKITMESINCYPEPAKLYNKLSEIDGLSPESFILTPGSDGAISSTFNVFINKDDKVLITKPTFAMYSVYCKIYNARINHLEYEKGSSCPFIDINRIIKELDKFKPKLFCLPNPDSPTGSILDPDELDTLIKFCDKLNIIILIDEAYYPFYDKSVVAKTINFKNLIVARTFSKAWGLAGLRLGYAVGNPKTIEYYHKIKPMYEIGSYSIAFIEKAIELEYRMRDSVKRIMAGKEDFINELRNLDFHTLNTEGNFLHVNFGDKSSLIHSLLQKKVLYRQSFDEECLKGFSRFTATTKENFKPVIDLLKNSLNS